ncbi:DNA adenine methylase [Listeria sp. ILCC797]|uniref:DNA adenine methylase n=1 Tax=Listeria sp. ILCC797 TaxID=1918333 RepID=UPI001C6FCD7D|nr:DNA adenine methylase [Listeria sp. ILCC797]
MATTLAGMKPFTKWVGGKRQLLPEINKYLPKEYSSYYEPFIGGGAVFFDLQPKKAVINDFNKDLILAYKQIRDNLEELIKVLEKHSRLNSSEYYYELRAMDRTNEIQQVSAVERAARLLYMLRVNFNGLYRVNKSGQFNVPYGRYKNPKIIDLANLTMVSEFLNEQEITILNCDFEEAVKGAGKGDFVYFDPPYVPLTKTATFTSYTHEGFSYEDQVRLRDLFDDLTKKGVYVMLSNSSTPIIHELYQDYQKTIRIIEASRMINSKGDARKGKVPEVIITNY